MKIYIGADHRGFGLKKIMSAFLKSQGHDVVDMGTDTDGKDCDYPQIAFDVAAQVAKDPGSRGVLLCMSGIGHSIAANKVKGAYAALVYNREAAALSRQHNDSNILVMGAKFTDEAAMKDISTIWLSTAFEGGRHQRRTQQIKDYENGSTH